MKWLSKWLHADVLFGGVFVFLLLYVVNSTLGWINFSAWDPIGMALDTFETDDLVYTAFRKEPEPDTNITLVNIGNLSRAETGELIKILNKYEPLVIGIDARFIKDKTAYYAQNGLPDGDSILASAFSEVKNLVLVTDLQRDSSGKVKGMVTSHPKFMKYAMPGFANMITEEDDFRVARKILPIDTLDNQPYLFFPVKVASVKDPGKANKFLSRGKKLETIWYRGNINNFDGNLDPFGRKDAFNSIDIQEVMTENFDPNKVKSKILLLGYMGETIKNNLYWDEDKFYTPLNKNFAGKSYPDMYGVVVHANVVSMILNETYIDEMPETKALILNLIICLFNVVLFSYIHHHIHLWWDGLSMLAALLQMVLLSGVKIFITMNFHYSIDIGFATVFVFLLGNLLELYYEYAKPGIIFIVNRLGNFIGLKKTYKK